MRAARNSFASTSKGFAHQDEGRAGEADFSVDFSGSESMSTGMPTDTLAGRPEAMALLQRQRHRPLPYR
jgi:hypothetical protein